MQKATAIAHPIQGLIKYHGMKDHKLRLPYHDSISVCMQELATITTVETDSTLKEDVYLINDKQPEEREKERMRDIIDRIRELANQDIKVKAISKNIIGELTHSYQLGKGLGYSASAGAALAMAGAKAFGLEYLTKDSKKLSTVARRLAGSAARSTVGGFGRWYAAAEDEKSFAVRLASREDIPDFRMVVYPISESTGLKTEDAHKEVETSPLFKGRLNYIESMLVEMEKAIANKDVHKISYLAEKDSFVLHGVTMTGENHLLALEPDSIKIYKAIKKLRSEQKLKAHVSWDTGPSTYVNTDKENADVVVSELSKIIPNIKPIVCTIGDEVRLTDKHLF